MYVNFVVAKHLCLFNVTNELRDVTYELGLIYDNLFASQASLQIITNYSHHVLALGYFSGLRSHVSRFGSLF